MTKPQMENSIFIDTTENDTSSHYHPNHRTLVRHTLKPGDTKANMQNLNIWMQRNPRLGSRAPLTAQTSSVNTDGRKDGNVLFNDALNTLRLYGVGHMVNNNSDCEIGNPLPPHGLRLPISSKDALIFTIPQTG